MAWKARFTGIRNAGQVEQKKGRKAAALIMIVNLVAVTLPRDCDAAEKIEAGYILH